VTSSPSARAKTGIAAALGVVLLIGAGIAVDRFDLFSDLTFAIQRTPSRMPSTRFVPDSELRTGVPILSLATQDEALNSPERGLLRHPLEKGVEWERPAYVSYFDKGELRFASEVGLRLHGGKSRENSPVQSFRLYFERRYGATTFGAGLLFDGRSDPLRQIVVHNDLRQDLRGRWWHFMNPLAFDIAAAVGAIVPETQPARVFLNGHSLGAYVLTEHVTSRGFQDAHFGHRGFTIADTDALEDMWRWQREHPRLTVADVEEVVDLRNLTNWFISVLFCATTDALQVVMLRDETASPPRWFWVNWDMDHSFMDLYQQAPEPWEHDTFTTLLTKRELRSGLVTRLLEEDARFAVRFKQALGDALNHRWTQRFLMERFDHYGRIAQALKVPDQDYLPVLAEFLRRRADVLRKQAPEYLPQGHSRRVTLAAPTGASFDIDDNPSTAGYAGWYFDDTAVRITVTGSWRDRFDRWVVNGRPLVNTGPDFTRQISEDLRIEAIFR
jgi:hypothetical protein